MCGRAAQTHGAVTAAAGLLNASSSSSNTPSHASNQQDHTDEDSEWNDNYNMSPGMSGVVFFKDKNGSIQQQSKVWGLVPKQGSAKSPLDTGMSQHFSNLMFNARSDTLLEKRTFANLFRQGRTCVIALDGFFEWKAAALKGDKKQPYYVYRKQTERPFLLCAGLWTSVSTGRLDEPTLDTFTIITTDACPSLTWLHSRMPLLIWDEQLALAWLEQPTFQVYQQLEVASQNTPNDCLQWHAVTTNMNSIKYRNQDAIKPVPPPVSVKSFFAPKGDAKSPSTRTTETEHHTAHSKVTSGLFADTKAGIEPAKKKPSPAVSSPSKPSKKRKTCSPAEKGTIKSFFSPKSK